MLNMTLSSPASQLKQPIAFLKKALFVYKMLICYVFLFLSRKHIAY